MNKLSKDVVISTIFSFLNVLLNFWLIREAEYSLSLVHLGVFMYIRRIAPTFANSSQLGTSQALIRFTSIEKDNEKNLKIYYTISIAIWVLMSLILLYIYFIFNSFLSTYFFSNGEDGVNYLKITFAYISLLHLSYIILPYFLNLRKILIYNIIQLSVASLIIFLTFRLLADPVTIVEVFKHALVAMFAFLLVLLVYIIVKLKLYSLSQFGDIKIQGRSFMKYGLPRSVITFSDMFLLTVGAMLIQGQEEIIGGFLIGITLSRAILIVLQPISLLAAVISGHGNSEERHKQLLNLLVGGTLYIAIITALILFNWIDVLLPYWLQNEATIVLVSFIFKLLAIGLVPYSLFQALKGIIEIKFLKPLNLYSLAIAIACHVLGYYILYQWFDGVKALSISLALSFIILGFLSLYWNRNYLKSHNYFNLMPLIAMNFVLFIINFIIHRYYPDIVGFIGSAVISGILFFIFCIKIKSPFLEETIDIFKNR